MRSLSLIVLLPAMTLLAGCPVAPRTDPPGLAKAEAALQEGRYGDANRGIAALPLVELVGPDSFLRAARVAAQAKDFALAVKVLDAETRGGRPSIDARLLRAEALLRSGDVARAKEAIADIERSGVRNERWRFLYALLQLVEGHREIGVQCLDDLVAGGSRDPEVLVRWAETALAIPREASRRLKEALGKATDRGPVLAALGAWNLLREGDPGLARIHLEEAVRLRPWDRDARLDLVRAMLRQDGAVTTDTACAEAEKLVVQDPADVPARLLLAQAWGEKGRLAIESPEIPPSQAAVRAWDRAEKEFGALLLSGKADPPTTLRAMQGMARIQVEEILLEPPGESARPGGHYTRAVEILNRAEAMDPDARMDGGPHGAKLAAETRYLLGRAARRAHVGTSDHAEAVGWYLKAFRTDPRHVDASWDLGLICSDFFAKNDTYRALAAEAFRSHLEQRAAQGMPPLDPGRMRIVEEALKRAGR